MVNISGKEQTEMIQRPVKKSEHSFIGRVFLRFSKYWMSCKDPKKRKELFKQAQTLGEMLEQEVRERNE